MNAARIRRQVYDLTPADLDRHPVWEYALDEEGVEGQDEATVRPCRVRGSLDTAEGMFIVRAVLTLADGTRFKGYLTPHGGDADLASLQPAVVAAGGQVSFWYGMRDPSAEHLAENYAILGKTSPTQVFPVRFETDVELAGGPVAGEVPGFLVLEDFESWRTRVVT